MRPTITMRRNKFASPFVSFDNETKVGYRIGSNCQKGENFITSNFLKIRGRVRRIVPSLIICINYQYSSNKKRCQLLNSLMPQNSWDNGFLSIAKLFVGQLVISIVNINVKLYCVVALISSKKIFLSKWYIFFYTLEFLKISLASSQVLFLCWLDFGNINKC